MINLGRQGATSEHFPLGGELPDISFDLTSGLNGDALIVEEHLRAVAGVTLALAAQQIRPQDLRHMAHDKKLSLKVLVVPKEQTGEGMPMQFGSTKAELGFHLVGTDLTVSGRQGSDPVSGAQFGWLGRDSGGEGVWRPSRAYAGTPDLGFRDYATVPIKPLERDAARRGVGYDRLIMAAHNLGEVATQALDRLAQPGKYAIQVEVNGKTTIAPMVSDPYLASLRRGQAVFRAGLLNGSI